MKTVEAFEAVITKLDRVLYNGLLLLQSTRTGLINTKGLSEQVEKFEEYKKLRANWYDEVYEILAKEVDRHYYLVQFANTTSGSYIVHGLGDEHSNFLVSFQDRVNKLADILQLLEERRNVLIRAEAAKAERDKSVLYEMTYIGREIRVNDVVIAKPNFASENDDFFAYVYERPWKRVPIEEIRQALKKEKFKKTVSQMLDDLGITGNIRQIFMPNASSNAIEFRNPITREFAEKNKLPSLIFGGSSKK